MFNRFRSSSISQTMTAIKRHYAARSTGGSAAPYTPYTPHTPYMGKPPAPTIALTLTGPNTITRGDMATYTASITPAGLTLGAPLTFKWTYTTTVRDDRDAVSITESIDATSQKPQTTTWSGIMVSRGTLEVSTTVNGTKLAQTMGVTVNKRAWVTDVSICKDKTSLGVEAPRSHTDLGNVEYDILFSPAHDLETAKVSSGPNKGIWYITTLKLKAPLVAKINRHFRMADADFPKSWVAFKNANTRYSEIDDKVEARLGSDRPTSGTLYGSWVSEINGNDPEADLEEFMEVPNSLLPDYKDRYENQIADRVGLLRTSRKAGMASRTSGWSPTGITINYNYFAARAGSDQTVDIDTDVNFDGSASFTLAGRTINTTSGYSWNFGSDADPATSIGVSPSCTYSTTGAKTVTLTVTDSAGDTRSDTMIVTAKEPLKRHPGVPVGMMGIQYKQLGKLQASFNSIYFGDREISHPACNYLHSYGYDFDNDKGWGLGDFDPNKTRSRAERNAKAWANFVGRVSSANNRLGAPTLKCLISNRLMTMHLNHGWSTEEISSYVRHTIKEIDKIRPTKSNPDPKAIVAGWYLGDDRLHPIKQTADSSLSAVIHAVHSAQKSCCVNWPFYFADNIDAAPFWNGANFSIPQKLKDWIDLFPDDATPVFMPYYYPWLSNNWDYTENPPWKKWKLYIEKLNKAFFNPDGTAKIHDNLKFHPILDASQHMTNTVEMKMGKKEVVREPTGLPLPGHADMHKQFRVVWNLLQKYPSVTGMWFLGWNIDDGVATSRATAHNNWTTNRKWAEAIQNEPHETEGILEAIPASNAILPNFPNPIAVPTAADRAAGNRTVTRIPYHLAERSRFKIEIRLPRNSDTPDVEGKLIRTINEGYTGKSPPGRFANSNGTGTGEPASMVLNGTSAHWDGNKQDNTPADDGTYEAFLVVNDTTYGPITITKGDLPRQNNEDNNE